MSIEKYRKQIDDVDEQIVKLIADRIEIAKKIGDEKKKLAIPITDEKREIQVLKHVKDLAINNNVDPLEIERIYRLLISAAKKKEE